MDCVRCKDRGVLLVLEDTLPLQGKAPGAFPAPQPELCECVKDDLAAVRSYILGSARAVHCPRCWRIMDAKELRGLTLAHLVGVMLGEHMPPQCSRCGAPGHFGRFRYFGPLWGHAHVWSTTDPPNYGATIALDAEGGVAEAQGATTGHVRPSEGEIELARAFVLLGKAEG